MSHFEFETPGRLSLRVQNKSGDVRLRARPGTTTEVNVTATSQGGAQLLDSTRVEHRPGGGQTSGAHTVIIEVPSPGGLLRSLVGGSGSALTVSVDVPEGADIEVTTSAGDIVADGPFGRAALQSASGDVTVGDLAGDLRAQTASGDLTVGSVAGDAEVASASGSVNLGTTDGRVRVKTASGDVAVRVARGHIFAQSASGDVRIGEITGGCQVQTASGDQQVDRALSGEARLETMSGDVTIGVARGTGVAVLAETVTGTLSSEIELGPERPGPGPAVAVAEDGTSGTPGGGGDGDGDDGGDGHWVDLRARTVTGDLVIKRVP